MKVPSFRVLFTVILSIAALAALQCSRKSPTSPQGEESVQGNGFVQLNLQMSKPLAQMIDRVAVIAQNPSKGTVRGNLRIEGTRATGSLQVPAGYEWTITAEAYIGGTKCYSGKSQPVYVSVGEEVQVTIKVNRLDSDGDGFYNDEDWHPYGDAKIQVVLRRFTVFCEDGGWTSESEVYFKIWVGEEYFMAPSKDKYWECGVGQYKSPNWRSDPPSDVADNSRYHTIVIEMWDYESGLGDDQYDIDSDATKSLNLRYDLKTDRWTGDDTDGTTKGADGYLEYDIKTVVE